MRYAVLGGGKRLRPMLVLRRRRTRSAATAPQLDAAACAVELIHAYSLVHDDLPAMDDDALRRGRPTCHIVFGEAMAILAGDALQALAFELLAPTTRMPATPTRARWHAAHARPRLRRRRHGRRPGARPGGRRPASSTLAELEHMHACKTGALIRAAVRLGALCGGADAGSAAGAGPLRPAPSAWRSRCATTSSTWKANRR